MGKDTSMRARRIIAGLAAGLVLALPTASAATPVLAADMVQPDGRTFCVIFPWFFTCRW